MPDPLTPADLAAMRAAAEAHIAANAELAEVRDRYLATPAGRLSGYYAANEAATSAETAFQRNVSPARVLALLAERDALAARVQRMEEALRAQEEAEQALQSRVGYGDWSKLEQRADELRRAALSEPGA